MKLPISVIVLTYNEEAKIEECLRSVADFIEDIFIVDSFSTDNTLLIAKKYTEKIYTHTFEDYSKQRNWALKNLPIQTEWVFNLDADIRVDESLKTELINEFSSNQANKYNGYLITRKTIFMGKWIKHGGCYPVYHAVLFKKAHGMCEEARYNQHFVVEGKTKILKGCLIDVVSDNLSNYIIRHNRWTSIDALDQFLEEDQISRNIGVKQKLFGNPMERRRYFRRLYLKLPLLIKPFIYFLYRYFLRLGFLDGKEGLIFHTLHAFWCQFVIDAKIYEIEMQNKSK